METKINIVEILKDKPQGTKLYSPIFGKLRYEDLVPDLGEFTVVTSDNTLSKHSFRSDSRYNRHGEPLMLLPSKEMRDWSKFAWKKGDILVNKDAEVHIIFDGFKDDTYKTFHGHYYLWEEEGSIVNFEENEDCMQTSEFYKANKEEAQTYINTIEERLGGKLNLETLEIEKQTKFKDGDIVFMKGIKGGYFANCIFILRSEYKDGDERAFYYAFYNADDKFTRAEYGYTRVHYSLRPATVSEKLQLFDALAKKGKRWDAEKKKVVDLPKKCEFKPFDKVICRDSDADIWKASFFSHYDERAYFPFFCNNCGYKYCLPYNDETAKLIGTTNNVEG